MSLQNACAYDQRSVSHWRQQSASRKWLTVSLHKLQLVNLEIKVIEAYYRSSMLLQQFFASIHQISSEFLIFQQDSDLAHWALEAMNFRTSNFTRW